MSQPSRPQAQKPAQRRRRQLKLENVHQLEDRCLLAPVVTISPNFAVATALANQPANTATYNVTVTEGTPNPGFLTAAPFTSVSELTSISSFGGDIVTIQAGPGGVFGNDVYAISRGAGENSANLTADQIANNNTTPSVVSGAINRPGVIYRVDPATGKTNVFFDLNTVISQLDTNHSTTAANSVGAATGLVNWYSITFDPEGYFNGTPSMLVSSVDRQDPTKNAIYQISPDGKLIGVFAEFSAGFSANKLEVNPSAILVPPPQQQSFLRGLLEGGGVSSTGGTFDALFFNANAYTPGQVISTDTLPTGVTPTAMSEGPIVGLTAANPDYFSQDYSVFTDFGTPAANGIPAQPGISGVQGINGEFLINGGLQPAGGQISQTPSTTNQTSADSTIGDRYPFLQTPFRRFESIAFDQYGFFAQGANIGATTTTTTGGVSSTTTGAAAVNGPGGGTTGLTGIGSTTIAYNIINNTLVRPTITLPPATAGNLFVGDLASGLEVNVAVPNEPTPPAGFAPGTINVPVQGPELINITNLVTGGTPIVTITPTAVGLGGRVVRITPTGVVSDFATNFHTTNATDSSSFTMSSLSVTFSADGTIMYVSDDDGIWQFKTVTDLASATSGSLIGLNDLRSLGVPYDGEGSAVAVIDTGVDAFSTPFRGRIAPGTNVFTGGTGNDDTSVFSTTFTATTTGAGGGAGGAGTGNPAPLTGSDGHGTPVAGVIAQFVPQATIVPVNIFAPFLAAGTSTITSTTGTTGGTGGTGTTGGTTTISATSNALTSSQYLYDGLNYVAQHPFVADPVRPGVQDRVIAATMAFGTTETFQSEEDAFKRYPQIVIALKNEMLKFRKLGITPIAATGQFGAPLGAGTGTTTGTGATGTTGTAGTPTLLGTNNAQNANVGDVNGIALPAILNEVVSVTGSYSFPFSTGPDETPLGTSLSQPVGIIGRQFGPVLVFGNSLTLSATTSVNVPSGTTTGGAAATTNTATNLPAFLANADSTIYTDRILGSANRNVTTDYTAPAIDVPTFRRTFAAPTTTAGTAITTGQQNTDHNGFNDAGTSLSAAEVTGAFALVSSALSYWSNIAETGTTDSAYLTQPAGVDSLTFGPHTLTDLTAWNNPDGINSILQWTAVPATDPNDGTSLSTPSQLPGSTQFPSYSRISVSNAIAAIEGYEALNYLINTGDLQKIDVNNDGIITATELQNFEDDATSEGMPTAAAMARLLGGTARITPDNAQPTLYGETPDQPDVLQRRFNFFDYAADGQLNGSVTIAQYKMLATKIMPSPDSFVINDRQKSSVQGYLLAPAVQRDYNALLHIKPTFQFIAPRVVNKYRNISVAQFHVARGQTPGANIFPVYTLFAPTNVPTAQSTTTPSPTSTAATTPTATQQTTTPATSTTTTTTTGTQPATTSSSSTTAATTTASTTTSTPTPTTTSTPTPTTTTSTPTTSTTTPTPTTSTPTPTSTSNPVTYIASQASLNLGSVTAAGTVTPTPTPTSPSTTADTSSSSSTSTSTSGTKTPLQSLLSKLGINL